jgi:hypothetical protein
MADWVTISSLATAGGTLVLAVATFGSVRSANRAARVAEIGLLEQRRPVLVQSRLDDPEQKIMFVDTHWVRVGGGRGVAERDGDVIYLAISLTNIGSGIGVLQSWTAHGGLRTTEIEHTPEDELRAQTRDMYIPAGGIGLWQGALRDPTDPHHGDVAAAVDERNMITVELLYSDQAGGQRTITRFTLAPAGDDAWTASAGRHTHLDRQGPR